MLDDDLGWLGAGTFVFLGFALWVAGAVATHTPPQPWVFLAGTAVFLAVVIGYSIWMSVGARWRPPSTRPLGAGEASH